MRRHTIPSLDGLRAVSILLVLFSHLVGTRNFPTVHHPLIANLGTLGVRVFFVISGFLITGLLLREFDSSGKISLKQFYFRRTFRIFPPYYFYLLVLAGFTVLSWLNIPWNEFLKPLTYTTNIFHTREWTLGHSWSLSIEEQFYLVWPGVLVLLGRRRSLWLLFVLVLALPIGRVIYYRLNPSGENHALTYGVIANLDGIATGCLLAILRDELHAKPYYKTLITSSLILILPLVLLFVNSMANHPNAFYLAGISILNVCIVLCVDWSITNPTSHVGRFLNWRPVASLGLISYSLYLWQQPFLNRNGTSFMCAFPLNIILALVMATLSYLLVEKTSLQMRQYLDQRWFQKKPL